MFLDLVPFLQTLRRKCQAMGNAFVEHGKLASHKLPILPVLVQGEPEAGPQAFSFHSAAQFVEQEFEKLNNQLAAVHRIKAAKLLRETRDSLQESLDDFRKRKEVHERRVISSAASTVLWLGDLGSKLNPIIQGIMNAVKVIAESEYADIGRPRMTKSSRDGQPKPSRILLLYALNKAGPRCQTSSFGTCRRSSASTPQRHLNSIRIMISNNQFCL